MTTRLTYNFGSPFLLTDVEGHLATNSRRVMKALTEPQVLAYDEMVFNRSPDVLSEESVYYIIYVADTGLIAIICRRRRR